MTYGSSNTKKFSKWFQIRWAEKLGYPDHPYLIRWTIILFGFSIRIHHWLRSDDNRYFHDHAANFISIVLKGFYFNVLPIDPKYTPDYRFNNTPKRLATVFFKTTDGRYAGIKKYLNQNIKPFYVEGMFNSWYNFFHCFKYSIWYSNALQQHYLRIPKEGAWTILFEGRQYHKWGFYVPRKKCSKWRENPQLYVSETKLMRPYLYFKKYGIIQTKDYQ